MYWLSTVRISLYSSEKKKHFKLTDKSVGFWVYFLIYAVLGLSDHKTSNKKCVL